MIFTCILIVFTCAALGTIPTFGEERRTHAPFITRLNLGVLFDPHSVLDNSNTNWDYLLQIRKLGIPNLPLKITNPCQQVMFKNVTNNFHICTLYETLIGNYERQTSLLQKDIRLSIETAHTLLDSFNLNNDKNRIKRGLINVVGTGFRYLFGLATVKDVHKTVDLTKQIESEQEGVIQTLNKLKAQSVSQLNLQLRQNKNMIDRLKVTYNRTAIIQQELMTLSNTVKQTTTDLYDIMFMYSKYLLTYTALVNQRIAALTLLQTQALEYLQDIQLLMTTKISPRLIPVETVNDIFQTITARLSEERSTFFITNANPVQFYSNPNFFFYSSDEYIYINLKIALSSYQSTFEVYRVITIPLPLLNNQTTNLYTTYKLPTYLAISTDKNYYIEMSQEDYGTCSGTPIKQCKSNMAIRTTSIPSCALSIFNDNINRLTKICDSTLTTDKKITQQFIPLVDDSYFVTGPLDSTPWILTCDNQHHPLTTPCTLCVVTLPCRCSLTTQTLIIPKTAYTCDKESVKVSTLIQQFHINFNFLTNWYYNESVINTLTSHSFLNHTPNIQLPQIMSTLPQLTNNEILDYDRVDIDMRRLVTKMQNNKINMKLVTQDRFPYIHNSSSHTITAIIVYTFIGFTIILGLITLFLYIKIQNLNKLIMVLTASATALPRTNAMTLTHDWPIQEQTGITQILVPTTIMYSLGFIMTILSITVIIVTIKKGIKYVINYQSRHYNKNIIQTEILLELTTFTQTTTLHIITIPTHYSQITVQDCSISLYSVISNGFNSYLRLNWNKTILSIKGKFSSITLPDLIPIPILNKTLTEKIIYDPNVFSTLWIGMHGKYQAISITNKTEGEEEPVIQPSEVINICRIVKISSQQSDRQ